MMNQYKSKYGATALTESQTKFYNFRKSGVKDISINQQLSIDNQHSWSEMLKLKKIFTNQFLKTLLDSDFARLLPHLELVSLSSGEELCQPGANLRYFYFPENAVISHLQVLTDGNSTEVAMFGRESIVGLLEILGSHSSPYWTQVTIAGNAFRIKAEILQRELECSRTLQKHFNNYLNLHLKQVSQKVVCNIHHQAEQRFCSWLLMLQDRVNNNDLSLTQDQIARHLGVHRPSITHIAQILREKEVINYVRSRINILNRLELERNACECYLATKESFPIEFGETVQ